MPKLKFWIILTVISILALVSAQVTGPHLISATTAEGQYISGNLQSLQASDDDRYIVHTNTLYFPDGWRYEEARVSVDIDLTGADLNGVVNIGVEASCDTLPPAPAVLFIYFYDWQNSQWEYYHSSSLTTTDSVRNLQLGGQWLTKFLGANNIVRMAVRGFSQDQLWPRNTQATAPFNLRIDDISLPGTSSTNFPAPTNLTATATSPTSVQLTWLWVSCVSWCFHGSNGR
jgi:hypothetical protein